MVLTRKLLETSLGRRINTRAYKKERMCHMSGLSLRRSVLFLSLLAFATAAWPLEEAGAQEPGRIKSTKQPAGRANGVGGTSLTLRDVWGPAEMPPAPKDFGPHFDFPPEALGGGLTHDPYPN
jgi:hypothetical protein